ncbi:MAG: MFS transporter [Hungatella hathewayi]|nr:MFS transporter [Hungatella hathewayi]
MLTDRHRIKLFDSGPLACFFFQAAFGTAFTYLTSGVFLSGLAILMGAGDVLVSYLSVIVNICGVLILLFSAFLERFQSRKRLTLALTALSKLAILFIVMIPALLPKRLQLVIFIPAVIIAFTLQAQTTVVLNQWMLGFMEEKKSGRYISLRQTMTLFVTVVLSLTAGRFMDYMNGEYTGFVILFAFAAVMGVIELVLLARTPDSAAGQTAEQSCKFRDIAKLPLKNRKFAGFVLYILLFYLLLYISDSFTMVYLMKYLALPYQTVNILYMIISLPQIILLGIWGKISDRRGHHFVLTSSIWLFAGETLFMSFASPETWFLFIPIAFLISSVANAGFVIAVFNRRYELMPEENRIVYDNFYTAAIGLGFILGPMIGGAIKHLLEESAFLTNAVSFAGIRLLYPISTVGILLLQIIYLLSQRNRKESTYVNH